MQAYLNGQFIAADQLHIAVHDAGFVMGATVAEQLRTFAGKLFRLEEHLDRFERSLAIVGFDLPVGRDELAAAAEHLVSTNHSQLATGDDLGLCLFATPGPYAAMAASASAGPTLAMHTYPIAFGVFRDKFTQGQRLVASSVPQIDGESLPRELKCRSRMHYYLADREAASAEGGARALMLDADGCVLEATTANVLIYHESEGLISPPAERILPGISVAALLEIAANLGTAHTHRFLSLEDAAGADEVMLTSTSVCALPVISIDGRAIGNGRPGPLYQQLLAGWNAMTGVDIAAQAAQFAERQVPA